MAVGLVQAVESTRATLIQSISELNEARCVYADLDKLVDAMLADIDDDTSRYGCLLQFMDMEHGPAEPYSGEIWQYYLTGILMIRLKRVENIELEMLQITEKLRTAFASYPRSINQDLALLRMYRIERPITSSLTDIPHYFLPFVIRIYDK